MKGVEVKIIEKIILIVLDSVGIGALPDSDQYNDQGANTLLHIAEETGGLELPNLEQLGLGKIINIPGLNGNLQASGAYGKMAEASAGKDTITGHWELAGLILENPFPTYPDGFPEGLIKAFTEAIGRGILGNKAASGTEIINQLGEKHIETGRPIVYTSADSVFQIAAHERIISPEELYDYCRTARKILRGKDAVGRVIARPFIGCKGDYTRTDRRMDFSLEPTGETMLDKIVEAGKKVFAVGKIVDIFSGRGISESNHTVDNMKTIDTTIDYMEKLDRGLIFTNLIEFDMMFGHRRDPAGYKQALKNFDNRLPEIMTNLNNNDLLIITADHGCDPTYNGTDHTREYVPLLIAGNKIRKDYWIGVRSSYSDLAATITELLAVDNVENGESFAREIINLKQIEKKTQKLK